MREHKAFKYLTNYKTQSIIFKNFLMILFVIILPISILFAVIYQNYVHATERKIDEMYITQLSNTVTAFDNIYSETMLFCYSIANSPAVIEFMSATKYNDLAKKSDYDKMLGTAYITYPYLESIYLYSDINHYILSNDSNDKIGNFKDKSWFSRYAYIGANDLYIIPRKINDSYPYCLSFMIAVNNSLNEKIGAVVVNLNMESLIPLISGNPADGINLYVLDKYKKLILSDDMSHMFDEFNQYAFIYDKIKKASINKQSSYTETSSSSGLEYILITNSIQQRYSLTPLLLIIAFTALILMISVLVSIYLALRTFKPIQNIIDAVGESGNIEKEIGIDNEISYIINNINATIQNKRLAEIELEQRIALLNNAYTVALQAQINPHFLYNTLETINFMAYDHFRAPNDISDITVSLSKMLRIGLDNETRIVPLSQEIEHLRLYVHIMERRYPDKCDFIYDIPDELTDCLVIKLILQPLVENSFQHGIRPQGHKGYIKVSAANENDRLIITIEDNGVGMDQATLESVTEMLNSEIFLSSKHIGINNVNRRIKILLGNEYGLTVSGEEGKGTKVTMNLPLSHSQC